MVMLVDTSQKMNHDLRHKKTGVFKQSYVHKVEDLSRNAYTQVFTFPKLHPNPCAINTTMYVLLQRRYQSKADSRARRMGLYSSLWHASGMRMSMFAPDSVLGEWAWYSPMKVNDQKKQNEGVPTYKSTNMSQ